MDTRRAFVKKLGLGTVGLIIGPVFFASAKTLKNNNLPNLLSDLISPNLTAVNAKLTTASNAGDGLDHDSTLIFVLHPTTDGRRSAEFQFLGRDATGGSTQLGDVKSFDLTLHTNTLTKDAINNKYSIDIIINAVGRDHYAGHLECIFHFDDGTIGGFDYDFAIGTFHESNQTGKVVSFD